MLAMAANSGASACEFEDNRFVVRRLNSGDGTEIGTRHRTRFSSRIRSKDAFTSAGVTG